MPFYEKEHRVEAGCGKAGRVEDAGVQTRRLLPVENHCRGPHLLHSYLERRSGVRVVDALVADGLVHLLGDLPGSLRAGLVATCAWVSGGLFESFSGALEDGLDRPGVRHHERGQRPRVGVIEHPFVCCQ